MLKQAAWQGNKNCFVAISYRDISQTSWAQTPARMDARVG